MKRENFFFFLNLAIIVLVMLMPVTNTYANVHFLTISDIHYGKNNETGYGHDTSKVLFELALKKFSTLSEHVDFIITLGDFPTHGLPISSEKNQTIQTVFHELYKADKTAKPFFYITGNNDSLGGDYQPFTYKGKSVLSLASDWQGACVHCKGLMIDDKHLLRDGYYSTHVMPKNKDIVLLALNSTPFCHRPWFAWPYNHQKQEALQQLAWLETQLKTLKSKQLLIAMHIPPGFNYQGRTLWSPIYLKRFIELLNKYQHHFGQISLLTAHTHMADLRQLSLDKNHHVYAYSTPSISQIHYNNPGMVVFKLNHASQLQDYVLYYTSKNTTWSNEHYHAIEGTAGPFAKCHGLSLSKCLDNLTNKEVCDALQKDDFYGVKSPQVNPVVCKTTYPVNQGQQKD